MREAGRMKFRKSKIKPSKMAGILKSCPILKFMLSSKAT